MKQQLRAERLYVDVDALLSNVLQRQRELNHEFSLSGSPG
jgi:hypothetical protein